MQTLPISTPQLPPAPAATAASAEGGADGAPATPGSPDSAFEALLSRSMAGIAHCAKGPAVPSGTPVEGDGSATDEAAQSDPANGAVPASGNALALLAALPQPAPARADGAVVATAASGAAEGVGGERAATAGPRPADLAAKPVRAGQGEPVPALIADPERIREHNARGAEPLPEPGTAASSHGAQGALPAHAPVAPVGADPAAAGPAPAAPRIETPLGAPGWSTALADRLVVFAGEKQQVAELHINPPHLGPLEITLTVSDDKASAVFVSPHAIVRETIESALPRLREVLAESGINLGQASVTADSPRDGSAQAQSRPAFSGGGERSGTETRLGMASLATSRHAISLVDLFA